MTLAAFLNDQIVERMRKYCINRITSDQKTAQITPDQDDKYIHRTILFPDKGVLDLL